MPGADRDSRQRQLEREHQPRTLKTRAGREPRISEVDERDLAAVANKHDIDRCRTELVETLDQMQRDLERVRELAPRAVAGVGHRSSLRAIANGLKAVRQSIDQS